MSKRITALLTAASSFAVLVPSAHAQVATVTIADEQLVERDRTLLAAEDGTAPTVQVTLPSAVSGVTVNHEEQRGGFPDLFVNGLASGDRIICVTLSSADGFYEAEGLATLDQSAAQDGVVRVEFPTQVRRFAADYANEVAAFVRSSRSTESCDSLSPVLATAWGSPTGGRNSKLAFLLGGQGRRDRPEVRYADQDTATLCSLLDNRRRSRAGYRWVCEPRADNCLPERDVVISWRRGARRLPGFGFKLRRTCF